MIRQGARIGTEVVPCFGVNGTLKQGNLCRAHDSCRETSSPPPRGLCGIPFVQLGELIKRKCKNQLKPEGLRVLSSLGLSLLAANSSVSMQQCHGMVLRTCLHLCKPPVVCFMSFSPSFFRRGRLRPLPSLPPDKKDARFPLEFHCGLG